MVKWSTTMTEQKVYVCAWFPPWRYLYDQCSPCWTATRRHWPTCWPWSTAAHLVCDRRTPCRTSQTAFHLSVVCGTISVGAANNTRNHIDITGKSVSRSTREVFCYQEKDAVAETGLAILRLSTGNEMFHRYYKINNSHQVLLDRISIYDVFQLNIVAVNIAIKAFTEQWHHELYQTHIKMQLWF